jgi:hypothetical protein
MELGIHIAADTLGRVNRLHRHERNSDQYRNKSRSNERWNNHTVLELGGSVMLGLVLMIVALLPMPQGEAAPQGVITVNVVNERSAPLIGATVWMLPMGGGMRASAVPDCLTDWSGTCSRDHLPVGKYLITAMKEAGGYPNGEAPLFNRGRTHVVADVLPDKLNVFVSYIAGPKAAAITVDAVDSVTGVPIKNPTIVLRSPADPKIWMSAGPNANSKILIPPDQDVIVEVSAPGYKPWRMEPQPGATRPNALHLHSEETKEFTVHLQAQ